MKKILGYIVILAGLIVFAAGTKFLSAIVVKYIPSLSGINSYILMVVGIVAILVGILFISGGKTKQPKEVPIYHGKNIVGYRRN